MILVLGGTSDSIHICNKLNDMGLAYIVSVTTEYGRDIAKKATENVFLGKLTKEEIEMLEKGVKIDDYISGKAKVKILKIDEVKDISRIEITIHEGKNREVRKMCNAIGKKVLALHRSRIGNINVKDLKLGEWKYLKSGQIKELIK